jgi:hypothetical protein
MPCVGWNWVHWYKNYIILSFYEIFINFRGHIYKGCAKIEKENE